MTTGIRPYARCHMTAHAEALTTPPTAPPHLPRLLGSPLAPRALASAPQARIVGHTSHLRRYYTIVMSLQLAHTCATETQT